MTDYRTLLRAILFPALALTLLLLFSGFYHVLGLPSSDEIVSSSERYFFRYGYWIIFVGAFLEATPVINFYLPGSTLVILGVAFSRHGTLSVSGVLATATAAFLTSYLLDYAAGYYGWHRLMIRFGLGPALKRSSSRMMDQGWRWLWVSYVHPNVGALTATTCGILHLPLRKFIIHSTLALICWNVFWGAVAFWGAEHILRFLDIRWLIPVVGVWLLLMLIRAVRVNKERDEEHQGETSN